MPEQQFKVGDKVVYPTQGVVMVEDIETKDIAGMKQAFYILRVLDSNRKIFVPVRNAEAVGLRPPMSETEVEGIFATLRDHSEVLFKGETWHKRYKGYQDMVKTGEPQTVAQVLRDLLMSKAKGRQLSFAERRLLDSARKMVAQEVAISRGISEDEAIKEIEALFPIAA